MNDPWRNEIEALREEVAALRAEVAALRTRVDMSGGWQGSSALGTSAAPTLGRKEATGQGTRGLSALGLRNRRAKVFAGVAALAALVVLGLLMFRGSFAGSVSDQSWSAPDAVAVTGTVTLDGNPMPDGLVTFSAFDGRPPVDVEVKGGHFTGRVHPGVKTVQINHYRDTGNKDETGKPIMIGDLPDRYNLTSTQRAEVKTDGTNNFEFAVTSH